jgi:hypothetical protein
VRGREDNEPADQTAHESEVWLTADFSASENCHSTRHRKTFCVSMGDVGTSS